MKAYSVIDFAKHDQRSDRLFLVHNNGSCAPVWALPWNGDPKNTWTLEYAAPKPRVRVKAGREVTP